MNSPSDSGRSPGGGSASGALSKYLRPLQKASAPAASSRRHDRPIRSVSVKEAPRSLVANSPLKEVDRASGQIVDGVRLDLRASLGPSKRFSTKPPSQDKRKSFRALEHRNTLGDSERGSRGQCLFADHVPLGILFSLVLLFIAGHTLTERKRTAEALSPGLGHRFKLIHRDDWCGHFEDDYQPPSIHGYYPLMTNFTPLVEAERHFSSRGNVEISFHPEIERFDASKGEDSALVLCFTKPVMMMVVGGNRPTLWVTTLQHPCASTPMFHDYLESERKRAVSEGVDFGDILGKGSPLRFAILVDVTKSAACFKVCKRVDDDCSEAVGSISRELKFVSLEKGVRRLALVSDGFAPKLRFHCRIHESSLPLCWAPGVTTPKLCPL